MHFKNLEKFIELENFWNGILFIKLLYETTSFFRINWWIKNASIVLSYY